MARIPSPFSISGGQSLRPTGPAPVADLSGIAQGAANLANSVGRRVAEEREKLNVIDITRAENFALKSYLDMGNQFEQDGEYTSFGERAEKGSQDILNNAGALIRDPAARQQWVSAKEGERLRQVDAISDRGRQLANEAERVSFLSAIDDNAKLISDPALPEETRSRLKRDIEGSLQVAQENGLMTPAQVAQAREQSLDRAEEQLALNRADALIRVDPQAVLEGAGVAGAIGDPMNDARTRVQLPIVASPGVDLANVDPEALTLFEQTQAVFGQQLPVTSAFRDPEKNAAIGGARGSQHTEGGAIDIDVSGLSQEEQVRLIETASAMGWGGIGVEGDHLHLDRGDRRAFGPDYNRGSVPGWAEDTIKRHEAGQITGSAPSTRGVDPQFAALTYEQRANIYDKAKQEVARQQMGLRTGLQVAVDNAPVAIQRGGRYEGDLPDANAFVQAYGVEEGIAKYEAFDASVKVAETAFSMRTMSAEDIAAIVEQSIPTDAGEGAKLQEQSFQQISTAAQQTLKARNDDPAAYTMQVFPSVGEAWEAVQDDPQRFQSAVTAMAEAQQDLGIESPQLLPANMATNAAAAFNNVDLPEADRIGALTNLVFRTQHEPHQEAIFSQLVAAGVPEFATGAMDALQRGDQAAASRLFRAALVDPDKLGKLPNDIKGTEVGEVVRSNLFDEGALGDIRYGLTYGTAENYAAAQKDMALIDRAVKLRLLDGTAATVEQAVDLVAKDMWGDVKPVTDKQWGGKAGLKLMVPGTADVGAMQRGFDALLPDVEEALFTSLQPEIEGAPTAGAERAIAERSAANYVQQVMSEGFFTNSGDGYVFIDPRTGTFVPGADGEPLTFSGEDLRRADRVRVESQAAARATEPMPMVGIGGF